MEWRALPLVFIVSSPCGLVVVYFYMHKSAMEKIFRM